MTPKSKVVLIAEAFNVCRFATEAMLPGLRAGRNLIWGSVPTHSLIMGFAHAPPRCIFFAMEAFFFLLFNDFVRSSALHPQVVLIAHTRFFRLIVAKAASCTLIMGARFGVIARRVVFLVMASGTQRFEIGFGIISPISILMMNMKPHY